MKSCQLFSLPQSKQAVVLPPRRLLRARHGLTLIEMMVAVTITLLLILAIVQVFGLLGSNIKNGQALIEVTTDLRFISQQLQEDLDGITCPVRTWLDPAEAEGGFEYYDGPSTDRDWNAVYDNNNLGYDIAMGEDSSMGDVDDYLWMTTRNNTTPFSGRVPGLNIDQSAEQVHFIECKDAEVTWWTAIVVTNVQPNSPNLLQLSDVLDTSANGRLLPTSSVALFRHAGLIVPGIDLSPLNADSPPGEFENGRYARTLQDVLDFLDNYDVSVRWIDANRDGERDTLMPNSLADLTLRQNRFMRFGFINTADGLLPANPESTLNAAEIAAIQGNGGFPFPLVGATVPSGLDNTAVADQPVNSETQAFALTLDNTTETNWENNSLSAVRPRFARFPYAISIFALSGETVDSYRYYSSIMARSLVSDNIRAFDVRAFDPYAPVYTEVNQRNIVIAPGDPGYPVNNQVKNERLGNNDIILSGLGAYVDLNYADAPTNDSDSGVMVSAIDSNNDGITEDVFSLFTGLRPQTNHSNLALVRWWPFYDTWSIKYERDGINQWTSDGVDSGNIIDEGTNGIDDNYEEGVDDINELETGVFLSYDTPLRGIKVSIRKMDYETRQLRQTSIVGDFVPE